MYHYKANLVRIIDGDTIVVDIDLGFETWLKNQHVRLYGINAPEVHTRDLNEKAKGQAATEFLRSMLYDSNGNPKPIELLTYYDKRGKFGRILAEVFVVDDSGPVNINEQMISSGHAVFYGEPVSFSNL